MNYNVDAFISKVEERKSELFDKLLEMIAIDSQNYPDGTGNERAFADYLAGQFKNLGIEPDVFSPLSMGIETHVDYYAGRHLEKRNNCVAVIPGLDHTKRLMLAAHEDTVIVGDKSKWTVNPTGELKDGRIYGRGACDDKYALAACIYILMLMKEQGIVLPYDIVVVGFSDEENGGSNGALAACLKYPCNEAIMLDGHNMEVVAGGAGGGMVRVSINCDDPLDSCALMFDAFDILRKEFDGFAMRRHNEFKKRPLFDESEIPDTTVRFTDVKAGMNGSALNHLETLITFYTTSDEQQIRTEWNEMRQHMNTLLADRHIHFDEFEMVTRFFHFTETDNDNRAMMHMSDMTEKYAGKRKEPVGMCLSDYPMFTYYATPKAFGFGGGRSFASEGGAHHIDEFIETDDFVSYVKVLAAFLLTYEI